jgi:hypothetical protein
MKDPAELYRASPRPYRGLPEPDIPSTIAQSRACGRICLGGRKINLSHAFAGQAVGIKEVAEKIWLITGAQREELWRRYKGDWSPQQIAGWLTDQYPGNPEMWVSHETIYRSLFVQARGALKKELIWPSALEATHPAIGPFNGSRYRPRCDRRCGFNTS